ncbi:MAG: glycosyltransferase, partial [Acidimicrobiia bacterium]
MPPDRSAGTIGDEQREQTAMRIGLIAPPWLPVPPPSYGGTEQVLDALARVLQDAGHDVVLFTTGDSTCPTSRRHVYARAERFRLGDTVPELFHTLCAYEALADRDIIHDHTIAGLVVAGTRESPPVVTTAHSAFSEELVKIYSTVQDRVRIVAISRDQASRVPDLRIARVIHHGLDPGAFSFGGGTGGYVLFLGRMSADKGVHLAARVARRANRRLLIAAKLQDPLEQRYFHEKVEPLLGDEVIHLGEVDATTKKDLLEGAVALINPIQWPEPFGLVMIEALASGTPVVALSEGAAPEIVDHGVTGFLCGDESEMVQALSSIEDIDR